MVVLLLLRAQVRVPYVLKKTALSLPQVFLLRSLRGIKDQSDAVQAEIRGEKHKEVEKGGVVPSCCEVGVSPKGGVEEALDFATGRERGRGTLIPTASGPFVSCADVPNSWIEPPKTGQVREYMPDIKQFPSTT